MTQWRAVWAWHCVTLTLLIMLHCTSSHLQQAVLLGWVGLILDTIHSAAKHTQDEQKAAVERKAQWMHVPCSHYCTGVIHARMREAKTAATQWQIWQKREAWELYRSQERYFALFVTIQILQALFRPEMSTYLRNAMKNTKRNTVFLNNQRIPIWDKFWFSPFKPC